MARILVIEAHPTAGSYGQALAEAYAEGARSGGAEVDRLVLGELEFDPVLWGGHRGEQALEPDLVAAQRAIEQADHLVFEFPVWWGNLPALLKGFIDRTFLPGWAFRNVEGQALPDGLLAGRTARLLATMDSPWWWYWFKHGRAAHRAMGAATLNYVGIRSVSETTVYGLRTLSAETRSRWLEVARAAGVSDAR